MIFGSPTFWRFLRYARPYRIWMAGSIISGVLKFSLALMLPLSLGIVTDYVILPDLPVEERVQRLEWIIAVLLLVYLIRIPIGFFRMYLAELAGNRTIFDVRQQLYRHLQRLSLEYYTRQRTGSVTSRLINDVNTAQGILDRGVMSVAVDFIFLVGVVAVLLFANWKLTVVSLFTLPMYGAVFGALNPKLREASRDVQAKMSDLSGEVNEKLAGQSVVIAFVREATERLHFMKHHREYFNFVMRRVRLNVTLNTLGEFLTMVGPMIVISYGGYQVIQQHLTLGELIAFNGIVAHLYLPTRRLADATAALQVQLAAMDRVFEVMDVVPDIRDKADAPSAKVAKGRIDFKNVSFGYLADQEILHNINLSIEPGQAVALVGPSGGGKTTLIKLVPRFYDVWSGSVEIDGQDVRDVTQYSLRNHIGMVMQDPILFNATIRDNILYGRVNATESEMLDAARMAHVNEFIADMPTGYDTIIGERGVTLSGGQKQRVSIARAFLRNPRILILDEATSNLDSHAEAIIQDALEKLMRGRTTLVIAHRLSTIIDCDKVIVLDGGHIIQTGAHAELVLQTGLYRELCEEQFGAVQM